MNIEDLQKLFCEFPLRRIAVLGDFFLDKYLEIDSGLLETSQETGRKAHQVVGVRRSPSAAGTVINNLAALGAGELYALGAIGDDGEGYDLHQGLRKLGCSTDGLLRCPEIRTPTSIKPTEIHIPGLQGEMHRYDVRNRHPTPQSVIAQLTSALTHILPRVDALIIMDQVEIQNTGVITSSMRDVLAELALRFPKVTFWADSRRNVRHFRNIIIKPNQFEAVGRFKPLPGDELDEKDLIPVVPRLRAETGATVFVTLGEKGIIVSDPKQQLIPGLKVTGPVDPTGAGDGATAGAVLTLASGGSVIDAAIVANLVAGVTVQQLGATGTATPAQVLAAFRQWQEQHGSLSFE